jgi:hypothetical protein
VVEPPPRQAPHPHLDEGPTASPRVHGMCMAGDGGDGDGGDGDGGDAGDGGTGEQMEVHENRKNAGHP